MPPFWSRERILRGVLSPLAAGALWLVAAVATGAAYYAGVGGAALLDTCCFGALWGFLILAATIDWHRLILPDPLLAGAAVAAAAWIATYDAPAGLGRTALLAGAGALLGFALFYALHRVSGGQFGFGDAKLAAVLGGVLAPAGFSYAVVALCSAILLGGLGAVVAAMRAGSQARFAYGPYLVAGGAVGIIWWASQTA